LTKYYIKFEILKYLKVGGIMSLWYDDVVEIEKRFNDGRNKLQFLNDLFDERNIAGYDREERLSEFYILYQWSLDTCGNALKITNYDRMILGKPDFGLPDILIQTREQIFEELKAHGIDSVCAESSSDLPAHDIQCSVCGDMWNIDNCTDVHVGSDYEMFDLKDYVGKPISFVQEELKKKRNAEYRLFWGDSNTSIKNTKYIDLTPEYKNPKSDYQKRCVLNKNGWIGKKYADEHFEGEYIIQGGDEANIIIYKYRHKKCKRNSMVENNLEFFKEIFKEAGIEIVKIANIRNQYCDCIECSPWLTVTTKKGDITLGWRKRVINIDFGAMNDTVDIPTVFAKEDVTTSSNSIHAWGKDKCVEYLKTFYNLI